MLQLLFKLLTELPPLKHKTVLADTSWKRCGSSLLVVASSKQMDFSIEAVVLDYGMIVSTQVWN